MHKTVRRFDRGGLEKPVKQANGWLRVDGYIARPGLLEYRRSDGSVWVEYRPEDEAFHADSLSSFSALPLTNDHPPEGYLDADNTARYQVGTIAGTPSRHDDKVRAQILVTDAATIAKLEAGKAELSCGYLCDLDPSPGEFEGRHYDAIQRNVRGNHVALVREGRAGPEIRVRLDTADAEVILSSPKDTPRMSKITLDGAEFEVPEQLEHALGRVEKNRTAAIEAEKARADAAEVDAKNAREALAAAPEKIKAEVAARVALESKARGILGAEIKLDEKSDLEIKRLAAETALGLKLDGKPDAYVDASFDLALVRADEIGAEALAAARAATAPIQSAPPAVTVDSARAAFLEASRKAHLSPK